MTIASTAVSASESNHQTSSQLGSVVRSVAVGGAAVGVLDALDGVAYFGLTAGLNPIQVLQYIASGAVGPSAFSRGLATAGLGALIHFALAFGFTAVFVLTYTRVATIRANWVIAGLVWGAAVWVFMTSSRSR